MVVLVVATVLVLVAAAGVLVYRKNQARIAAGVAKAKADVAAVEAAVKAKV
jgi:hypothetical protein